MSEILPTPLKLVTEQSTEIPALHPFVEDQAVFLTTHEAEDGSHHHLVRFGGANLDGPQVAEVLGKPLLDLVGDHSNWDVYQGLRAQTYPNNRIARNAKNLGPGVVDTVQTMRQDLRGLARIIDGDNPDTISAKVHLYDPEVAKIEAEDKLGKMKPSHIKQLCDQGGIAVDELALWRARGSGRDGRVVNLRQTSIDSEQLAEHLIATTFMRKSVVDRAGTETALIPRDELPAAAWVEDLPYVERIRYLPPLKADSLASRWQILLRREGTPRHVAMPVLKWRSKIKTEDKPASAEFLYSGGATYYDRQAHRVVHSSPLLGAAMLVDAVSPDTLSVAFNKLAGRNPYTPWSHTSLPPKFAGVLPTLLVSKPVAHEMLNSDAFIALRDL